MSNGDGGKKVSKFSGKARLGVMDKFQGNRGNSKAAQDFLGKSPRFEIHNMFSGKKIVNGKHVYYFLGNEKIFIPEGMVEPIHEIAHIIEMNDNNRLLQDDFGMKMAPHNATEKYTLPMLAREARVRMIQMIMVHDKPFVDSKTMGTINPLNNSIILGMVESRCIGKGKFQTLDDIIDWVEHILRTTINVWDMDRIHTVWNQKIEFFENHFATVLYSFLLGK